MLAFVGLQELVILGVIVLLLLGPEYPALCARSAGASLSSRRAWKMIRRAPASKMRATARAFRRTGRVSGG